jgi:hypothetical protein
MEETQQSVKARGVLKAGQQSIIFWLLTLVEEKGTTTMDY